MPDFVQAIRELIARLARLFGIGGKSSEERDDLEQSAYAIALELERERDKPIDWDKAEVRDELKVRVKREWNRWRRGRRGSSLDQPQIGKDGEARGALIDTLKASSFSDPLEALLGEAVDDDRWEIVLALREGTYSEFAAYLTFLMHLEFEAESAADYLKISPPTLTKRVTRAYEIVQVQPSPFDRIARISSEFSPKPGRIRPPVLRAIAVPPQLALPLRFFGS